MHSDKLGGFLQKENFFALEPSGGGGVILFQIRDFFFGFFLGGGWKECVGPANPGGGGEMANKFTTFFSYRTLKKKGVLGPGEGGALPPENPPRFFYWNI